MKVAILGSTGPTGTLVVEEALRRGYEVVAVARTPGKLKATHKRLTVVRADVTDQASLERAVSGVTSVISCIGSPSTRPPITLYSHGTANLLQAMKSNGIERVVVLSSGALKQTRDPNYPLFFELVIKRFVLNHVYADMRQMEEIVAKSGTAWTLIRPSRLTDKPGKGPLREAESEYSLPNGFWTSRDKLAELMVTKLEDDAAKGKSYAVAN